MSINTQKNIEKVCGVYLIISPSNRRYIGSSIDIYGRWGRYEELRCKTQTLLYRSFAKYGTENHIFIILYECNPDERLHWERIFGDLYLSLSDFGGLNCQLPKSNDIPQIHSQYVREKMSKGLKKLYSENPKLRQEMNEMGKINLRSAKCREKCVAAQRTESYRKKRSDLAKRLFNTPEAKKANSERTKKRFSNPEERKAQSERTKRYFTNPEAIERNRQQAIKRFENPEKRKEAAEKTIAYFRKNPDAGKRHSEKLKEFFKNGGFISCSKKVINTKTGEVFPTIRSAANSIGMNKGTLSDKLNGRYNNNTEFLFHNSEKAAA